MNDGMGNSVRTLRICVIMMATHQSVAAVVLMLSVVMDGFHAVPLERGELERRKNTVLNFAAEGNSKICEQLEKPSQLFLRFIRPKR